MEKKKTYLVSNVKKQCTGCGACASACPKKAIKMIEDLEGFFYPQIDKSKCINCHICEKVCPVGAQKAEDIKPKAYYYITQEEKDLLNASSGGAFGDIINAFYEKDKTIVYGCIFDKNNKAIHIGFDNKEDMDKFKKSKYVQSNLLNTFCEINENLKKGKKVLFSGTPCQVSGLKSFLKKKYDNLLCIDIICHGVPSQKVLDYYIKSEEKNNNSSIASINFREKILQKNGKYNSRNMKLVFTNGEKLIKSSLESSYLLGFHSHLFYRPSCYKCSFCKINRDSDITIADCWGFESINDKYDLHKGVSCVIINSLKGQEIFKRMNGIKDTIPLDFIIKNNSCYTKPTKLHRNRKKFFKKLTCDNFEKKVKKNYKLSFFSRFKRKVIHIFKI